MSPLSIFSIPIKIESKVDFPDPVIPLINILSFFLISKLIFLKKNSLELLDINFRKPNPNQVLVKINYSGICASQYMEYRSLRGKDKWLPHMFGHEGVGTVKMLGKEVKGLKVGNKVILSWIKKNNNKDSSGFILLGKKKLITDQ